MYLFEGRYQLELPFWRSIPVSRGWFRPFWRSTSVSRGWYIWRPRVQALIFQRPYSGSRPLTAPWSGS